MQRSVRTFIAVEVSSEVRLRAGRLIGLLEATGSNVRWVKPEQLHLTLKFLGDVDLRDIPEVCAAVSRATSTVPPFTMRIAGAGAFPNLHRPRTVWLGADEGVGEMGILHQRIESALAELGFRGEHRQFRPHLTIGRVRNADQGIDALADALSENRDFVAGLLDVDEVVTFSSERERSGPIHEPLAIAELAGD
jgi:RNA 2',3'-cyclic 3'-phosphodiesterase